VATASCPAWPSSDGGAVHRQLPVSQSIPLTLGVIVGTIAVSII
jgi:hypothetical protein